MPIGTRLVRPSRMLSAITSRSFLTSSMPPTTSNPCAGSTNSTSPKHSRSMISRFRLAMSRSVSLRARSIGLGSVASGRGAAAVGATSSFISSRFRLLVSAASLCARPAASGPPPSKPAMNASRSADSSSTAGGGVRDRRYLDRLQTCGDSRIALSVLFRQTRVRKHRGCSPRVVIRHRHFDHRNLRIGNQLRRQLGQVLGDEQHDVIAAFDLRQRRPAMQASQSRPDQIRSES